MVSYPKPAIFLEQMEYTPQMAAAATPRKSPSGFNSTVSPFWNVIRQMPAIAHTNPRTILFFIFSPSRKKWARIPVKIGAIDTITLIFDACVKVGDKILFDMATGTKVEQQTLIYRGRKNFKAENGVKYQIGRASCRERV